MKNILVTLLVLVIVGTGTYYLVFNNNTDDSSEYGLELPQNTQSTTGIEVITTNNPETPAVEEVVINIKNFSFNPPTITVKKGTKVTWINSDGVRHSVVSSGNNLFNSPLISQGQSFSFVFTDALSVDYYCGPHPTMKGKIIVID